METLILKIGGYILIGLVYTGFLENFTLNNFNVKIAEPWSWKERLYHILYWPLSLVIFIVALIKEIIN
mgnify:FL=1